MRLVEIFTTRDTIPVVTATLIRFVSGLGFGILIGSIIGFLFGTFSRVEEIFSPYIHILQATPPVCWVVLALVWFGLNGKPSIFIVATATIPIMVINLSNGIKNIDRDLLEMAHVYHFSRFKTLRHVIIPSVTPYFQSALEIVIGNGWKLVVMAELLTTNSGIGGQVMTARLNIEPDIVIAWAIVTVAACYLCQALLRRLFFRKRGIGLAKN